ncbi:peroxisome biogenesis protein 5-like [Aristolochia californica]|uniref:peroxisome biogenesis protein 5-like n=1 Tax=Aristolochia californica TaxID=171875 RepID=UPI0035E37204
MAMRDLVTGGAACAVPGASSSSNPFGAFANSVIGSASKTQGIFRELPSVGPSQHDSTSDFRSIDPLTNIPGSESDQQTHAQSSEFLQRVRAPNHGSFDTVWDEFHQPPPVHPSLTQGIQSQPSFDEFDHIFNQGVGSHHQPTLDGPPQRVLSSFLHSFVNSGRSGVPFQPASLPVLGLSESDKQRIRNRSTILSRHIFSDRSEDFINAQVNALLHSLDIDNDFQMKSHLSGRSPELEEYWNEIQGAVQPAAPHAVDHWVTEFNQHGPHENADSWAKSFQLQHGANGWASEFEQEQSQIAAMGQLRGVNMSNLAMEQSRMLAETLSKNNDPKFKNSKFLQFVSKMSQGELIVDDNQIKPAGVANDWADQFSHENSSFGGNAWADEFTKEQVHHGPADEQWANEFTKLHLQDWGEEFGQQVNEGTLGGAEADEWVDNFFDEMWSAKRGSDSSKTVYVFSDMNPYVGHPDPLKEGQELFRKGLLSEAVLALEAEVLKNPENAEGWRLLGITHAENDDDQQAIASMMQAHEVDSTNLEVLLALGVSHTNELEQAEALKYLYGWLQHHPKYGTIAPPEKPENSLYYPDVIRLFNEAAQMSPEDADVHIVLGVLYNLSREYDKAISSFKTALQLRSQDYSLWNKLGATQANSVQSADAIVAYQRALDLKPNYVRAWANMGISYANQGMHEESIRYYVRALAMNPKADNAWQYLKFSLSCASRNDMFEACDSRNLELLQKEFPL